MAKAMYIDALQIGSETELNDNFAVFEGVMTSDRLNTKGFKWTAEAMRAIIRQANTGNGVPIYPLHDKLNKFNIGRTRSARVRNGEGLVTFDIQRNQTIPNNISTDELIDRMRAGTVDSLSTGTVGGDFICDLDNTPFEFKSDGMFSYSRKCGQGHRLNETVRYEGKNQAATATVKGEPRLQELSVVGSGAIANTKITKQLGEMLSTDEISPDDLYLISEINGFRFNPLMEQLGIAPVVPEFYRDPENDKPIPLSTDPEGDTPMATDTTLIEKENEALSKQVDTLNAEKAEIQKQLDAGCTAEEAEALESQLEESKTDLKAANDSLATSEKAIKDGKVALDYLHAEAKRYQVSAFFPNDDITPEELTDLEQTIADTPPDELRRSIKRLKKKTFENREGGRKSKSSAAPVSTQPEGYTKSAV